MMLSYKLQRAVQQGNTKLVRKHLNLMKLRKWWNGYGVSVALKYCLFYQIPSNYCPAVNRKDYLEFAKMMIENGVSLDQHYCPDVKPLYNELVTNISRKQKLELI
jgi:hypothetical protein